MAQERLNGQAPIAIVNVVLNNLKFTYIMENLLPRNYAKRMLEI